MSIYYRKKMGARKWGEIWFQENTIGTIFKILQYSTMYKFHGQDKLGQLWNFDDVVRNKYFYQLWKNSRGGSGTRKLWPKNAHAGTLGPRV